jgi:hypothetical protein
LTQRRYINYGSTADASGIKGVIRNLAEPGILNGFELLAAAPNQIKIDSGGLVFTSGILLEETEVKYLTIPITAAAINYTIVYTHTDQDIVGGVAASLNLVTGLFSTYANSVILGWIKYPGGSINVANNQIYPAPKKNIVAQSTRGDKDVYLPQQSEAGGSTASIFGIRSTASAITTIVEYDATHGIVIRYPNSTGGATTDEIWFPFVARTATPRSIITEFAFSSTDPGISLGVEVLDTLGNPVTNVVVSDDVAISADTLVTRTVRMVGGVFTAGKRYHVKLTLEIPDGEYIKVASLGASTYELPI